MDTAWDWIVWLLVSAYGVVKEFQTLIAGLVAIYAAKMAAKPVWRQLRAMGAQTNLTLREYLQERYRRTKARRKWLVDRLHAFQALLGGRIQQDEQDGNSVNVEWAHVESQNAGRLVEDLRQHLNEYRGLPEIDGPLDHVLSSLEALEAALDAIHRPFSMDQHSEDRSFTDEEWAKIEEDGRQAEKSLPEKAAKVADSTTRLESAFDAELKSLRARMHEVDQSLMKTAL